MKHNAKMISRDEIRARQAQIVDRPARIPPLDPSELGREASEAVAELRKAVSLPPTNSIRDYTATMLRHPVLYRRHVDLGLQLFGGALSPRRNGTRMTARSFLRLKSCIATP